MKKIFLSVLIPLAIVITTYFVLIPEISIKPDIQVNASNNKKENNLIYTESKKPIPKSTDNTNAVKEAQDLLDGQNNNYMDEADFTINELKDSKVFSDLFLTKGGGVSQHTLTRLFRYSSFSRLIDSMNDMPKSSDDYDAEFSLTEHISKQFDNSNIDARVRCAKDICLLSIDDTLNVEQNSFDGISGFRKNFSFVNFIDNENGGKAFRAIYIKTDDPSKLVLSQEGF